jgi:hypothetical protein
MGAEKDTRKAETMGLMTATRSAQVQATHLALRLVPSIAFPMVHLSLQQMAD